MLPPKMILSPVDFSSHSDEALNTAADLALQFGSELYLLHVVPAIPKLPSSVSIFHEGEYEQELHKDAVERLSKLASDLAKRGVKAKTEVGTANDVGMEIVRASEHDNIDLIVIATHGMTGWHRLAFGSVAEKVVRLAACPVLVLRAHPAEKADAPSGKPASVAVGR
jgi:nucleotide-binding universal stress UspA family protein